MKTLQAWLQVHAAWVSAAGLVCYALYEASTGNWSAAGRAALGALTALGVQLNLPKELKP